MMNTHKEIEGVLTGIRILNEVFERRRVACYHFDIGTEECTHDARVKPNFGCSPDQCPLGKGEEDV